MTMPITLVILLVALAGFAFCSWRAALPTQFGKVRMMPWTALSLVSALVALMMLVHVLNLLGIETGTNTVPVR